VKPILIALLALQWLRCAAQSPDSIAAVPHLQIDLPLADVPYALDAARTVNDGRVTFGGLLKGYANPSMQQSLALSADFYTGAHYGLDKALNRVRKKSLLTKVAYQGLLLFTDFMLGYVPGGEGWVHEEYHRAAMTRRHVNSFNDVNRLPLGADAIAVSHVTDADLIRFKQEDPAGLVRMQAAGIEGGYLMIDKLQRNNFFYQQRLSHEMQYWLTVINSATYVLICSDPELADPDTDEMNAKETDVKKRDFTGLDFLGWAYDIFGPNEPYTARGPHPTGNGLNRYRKTTDLQPEQLAYLKRQGNLQFLNLLSPMMLGIRSIPLGSGLSGNFAVRNFLTSFGNDISLQVYLMKGPRKAILSLHHASNYRRGYPAAEVMLPDFPLGAGKRLLFSPRLLTGIQPRDASFTTRQAQWLGMASGRVDWLSRSSRWSPYLEVSAKTAGWVAGNEFLQKQISGRFGLSGRFAR
jgi:hypothetical protein